MDTNIKIKKLQQKIRDLRKVHKLSGTEMAKDMNEKYNISLNKGTISKWENGIQTPSTEYIFYLCDYFKVDANWFLGLKKQNSERKNAIKDKKEKIEKVGQFLKEKRKEKNLSMENLVKEIKRKYKKPLNKGICDCSMRFFWNWCKYIPWIYEKTGKLPENEHIEKIESNSILYEYIKEIAKKRIAGNEMQLNKEAVKLLKEKHEK